MAMAGGSDTNCSNSSLPPPEALLFARANAEWMKENKFSEAKLAEVGKFIFVSRRFLLLRAAVTSRHTEWISSGKFHKFSHTVEGFSRLLSCGAPQPSRQEGWNVIDTPPDPHTSNVAYGWGLSRASCNKFLRREKASKINSAFRRRVEISSAYTIFFPAPSGGFSRSRVTNKPLYALMLCVV